MKFLDIPSKVVGFGPSLRTSVSLVRLYDDQYRRGEAWKSEKAEELRSHFAHGRHLRFYLTRLLAQVNNSNAQTA